MMKRYPISFLIEPRSLEKGRHWITVTIQNIGVTTLKKLDLSLASRDTSNINILVDRRYLPELGPQEEEILPFQIETNATSKIYLVVTGRENDETFHWESPFMKIRVAGEVAEIERLAALTHPYPMKGKEVDLEARIAALQSSQDLRVQFWARKPTDEFEEIASETMEGISSGEIETIEAKMIASEEGL
jgi:hypothetical protein